MKKTETKTILLLLFSACVATAQYVTVPVDHQVYRLLVKGETLEMFRSYNLRVLPLTRNEVLALLDSMKRNSEMLSTADAELLAQMLGEFANLKVGEREQPESEIHAYRYEEGMTQVFVDLRGVGEVDVHRGRLDLLDENLLKMTGFGSVRAQFGDRVFVGLSARNGMTLGKKDRGERFDVTKGETQVAVGSSIFTDQATGFLATHVGPLSVYLGRTDLSWGSGLQERLGISFLNEPMDQIRLSLDLESFRFSYVHANLQGIGSPRFLAGHRLDLLIGGGVQLGAYETVVYGGRGAEFSYLNPLLPYHFMEHQLGDRDNNTLGIDATAILKPGVRVFAEIFVDDLSFDFPLDTYWGNKLAVMAGLHWAQPFDVKTLELFTTYTRVDPFVYTHQDSLNVYSHYGTSIGSRIGPNADRYYLSCLWRPDRDLICELTYSHTRKGKGDIFISHKPEDGESKDFLSGTLDTRHNIRLHLQYQFLRDMFFALEGSYLDEQNGKGITGLTAQGKTIRFFLDINY